MRRPSPSEEETSESDSVACGGGVAGRFLVEEALPLEERFLKIGTGVATVSDTADMGSIVAMVRIGLLAISCAY